MNVLTNWKTSLIGVVVIAGGILLVIKGDQTLGATVIMAGVGLIAAKDAGVTGAK
jgi:hypothetical protein